MDYLKGTNGNECIEFPSSGIILAIPKIRLTLNNGSNAIEILFLRIDTMNMTGGKNKFALLFWNKSIHFSGGNRFQKNIHEPVQFMTPSKGYIMNVNKRKNANDERRMRTPQAVYRRDRKHTEKEYNKAVSLWNKQKRHSTHKIGVLVSLR
ncbi:hypothetical protein EVAR_100362_1 [Eumeta japonica]|uniref:Uncharacterized protein n=1 Tax=Eumeta variegata TaxID=151549 RepID=A0A4C2A9J3_EUMVA|nr:hypothetical protein EVAR_100362_1 [Eumeta japonica]